MDWKQFGDIFLHLDQSIDRSTAAAGEKLSAEDNAELERLSGDEIRMSRWYQEKGLAFMREHPSLTLSASWRKLIAGFSWKLNPLREPLAQWSYAAFYAPASILGLAGILLARRRRETLLIAMAFVSFIGVTAVFWAHTSIEAT